MNRDSSLNNEALAHRVAIAKCFANRLRTGDAFFLGRGPVGPGMPYTINNGIPSKFGGMNALMLLQVMKDKGWRDARFFTTSQIREAGLMLQSNHNGILLQYLMSTEKDGLLSEQPQVKQFRVFNGTEVDGIERFESRINYSVDDVRNAAFAAGNTVGDQKLTSVLEQWLQSLNSDDQSGLAVRIAASLLETQTGITFASAADVERSYQWAQSIDNHPLALFEITQQAHIITADVMKAIQIARAERDTEKSIQKNLGLVSPEERITINTNKGVSMVRKTSPRVEEMFRERVAVLSVPYEQKDRASALGAVWYPPQRIWFVPKGLPIESFKEWDVRVYSPDTIASTQDILDSFAKAMINLGLEVPDRIAADGKWHNVPVTNKKGKNKSGAYILTMDGSRTEGPIGNINNKYTGEQFAWLYDGPMLTPEQRARKNAMAKEREARAEREIEQAQNKAAIHAKEIWELGISANDHGYVIKKGISAQGLRQVSGSVLLSYDEYKSENGSSVIRSKEMYLLVPMMNENGEIRALQAIHSDGRVKSFMRGAQKKGLVFVLGFDSLTELKSSSAQAVAYAEGYATGDSIHTASGLPVIICFDAGNMETIVDLTKTTLPLGMTRVLGVDNDQFFVERGLAYLEENIGLNSHIPNGETVQIANGKSLRTVTLGELKADDQWHQATHGTYCANFEHDVENDTVRSLVVEMVPTGERKTRATFENRGVEVGRSIITKSNELAEQSQRNTVRTVMVVPEFKNIEGRPTDFNDLVKSDGIEIVRKQFINAGINLPHVEMAGQSKTKSRETVEVEM